MFSQQNHWATGGYMKHLLKCVDLTSPIDFDRLLIDIYEKEDNLLAIKTFN